MKAALYSPYLNTLGGGERYLLSFARVLLELGYETFIEWKDSSILETMGKRFSLDTTGIEIINSINKGDGYDLTFWVSDGSIPLLYSRRNLLHFQVPFHDVGGKSLLNKMKLFRIEKIIANSNFTKNVIDNEYGFESVVVYPPVGVDKIKPKRKDNTILYVGRFSRLTQSKRQDVLIDVFEKYFKEYFKDYKLILAGGGEVGEDGFIDVLKEMARGYPIEIMISPKFDTIRDLYGKAKYFWSAAGYGVDPQKEPEKMEHFGITVVEAMAGGAVPIVYDGGGHKEIIEDGVNGLLWSDMSDIPQKLSPLYCDRKKYNILSQNARNRAGDFSFDNFKKEIEKIILKNA